MTDCIHISNIVTAGFNFEGIIPVVVVIFVIIANILKASKKAGGSNSNRQNSNTPMPNPITGSSDELDAFLKSLSGETAGTPAAPPPQPARQVQQRRPQPPPAPPIEKHISHEEHHEIVHANRLYNQPPSVPVTDEHEMKTSELRKALTLDMADNNALKKAFLLREILGPPLAIRGCGHNS